MEDSQKEQEVFRQNLDEKGSFQTLFQMYLLFTDKGTRPDGENIHKALSAKYEKVDIVANVKDSLSTFAIWKYIVEYKDNQRMPAQVLMSDFENFDGNNIDLMQRSQLWDCPEKDEILANCKYKIMLSDFMASGLPYKERCALLTEWLETTLELFPDCAAVWTPSSGKLLTREQVLNNPWAQPGRFLHFGMNVRFFNIQNTNDMLVDTLGLYAIGLPYNIIFTIWTRMPWSITPITWPPISSTKTPPSKMEKPSTVSLNRELTGTFNGNASTSVP